MEMSHLATRKTWAQRATLGHCRDQSRTSGHLGSTADTRTGSGYTAGLLRRSWSACNLPSLNRLLLCRFLGLFNSFFILRVVGKLVRAAVYSVTTAQPKSDRSANFISFCLSAILFAPFSRAALAHVLPTAKGEALLQARPWPPELHPPLRS